MMMISVVISIFVLAVAVLPEALIPFGGKGCSEEKECETGCCSKSGYCGFGPEFCDPEVCVSTCDEKAECGEFAPKGKELCPLNVCCSEYGFCGVGGEFCNDGCQNGCAQVYKPSCSGSSASQRYVGYYESWNTERACQALEVSHIDVKPWTHLNYAFALVDEEDGAITPMEPEKKQSYSEFKGLKVKKPSLKTYISIGGWAASGKPFSRMASDRTKRKRFIDSAIKFMKKHDFDGIDLDWEYPVAKERGGSPEDKKNYVTLLKELRKACGTDYGITVAIPASYWYLKGFDVQAMAEYVDWFNFMSYDIHGTWDGDNKWTEPVINPHTNLTEISSGLDLLWRNRIDPDQVLLGLGFYGRSFRLSKPDCTTPGCPFAKDKKEGSGGGDPGRCTGTSGILSSYEISEIIQRKSPHLLYDEEAAVKWITWSKNQWVAFDDAQTLKRKAEFANQKCLGGTFGWAIDLGGPAALAHPLDPEFNVTVTGDDGADLDGPKLDGSDSGSGDVYISPDIYKDDDPVIACNPPCNFIFPPIPLGSATTITFPPFTTSLEVVWPTTTLPTTLSDGSVSTSTGLKKTIVETVLTIPAVTTSFIGAWELPLTKAGSTSGKYTLDTSILPPPFIITNSPDPEITDSPEAEATTTQQPVTRTITPPPYPYPGYTQSDTDMPSLSFTVGPPKPSCTSGCGHKCKHFCSAPCSHDCPDGGEDFADPQDDDPPVPLGCRGKDCINGKCREKRCLQFNCEGDDCVKGTCLGPRCIPKFCIGPDCHEGICKGKNCLDKGQNCFGPQCGMNGGCHGPNCIGFRCLFSDCGSDGLCHGPDCSITTCSGAGCDAGLCSGPGCEPDEQHCKAQEAQFCEEIIMSSAVGEGASSTTTTESDCSTVTACSITGTTVTTTVTNDRKTHTLTEIEPKPTFKDDAELKSFAEKISESLYPTTATTSDIPVPTVSSAVDDRPYCFNDHNDDNRWGITHRSELYDVLHELCARVPLSINSPGLVFEGRTGATASITWATNQTGCAEKSKMAFHEDYCLDTFYWMYGICEKDSPTHYGGVFIDNDKYGCVKFFLGDDESE